MTLPIPIALDSGAHTLFSLTTQKGSSKTAGDKAWRGRERNNLQATHKSKEFKTYLNKYINFLHKYNNRFSFYVTLDLIYNPKGTWEVYQEMRANGLSPLPVLHSGEEKEWLFRYLKYTDSIGIGGIAQQGPILEWTKSIFKAMPSKKGYPECKVHGFGMTALGLLSLFPWTTVDSTSAFQCARWGGVLIPAMHKSGGKWHYNYLKRFLHLSVTHRSAHNPWHFQNQPPGIREGIKNLFEEIGVTYTELANYYMARDYFNLCIFNRFFAELSKQRGFKCIYYASGNPSAGPSTAINTVHILKDANESSHIGYIGTYYQLSSTMRLLNESVQTD